MITPEQLAGETEDSQQRALICYCGQQNKYPELKRIFAIPNGGFRNIREAAKFKTTGTRSGVPDLFLPIARGKWHGLFVELKKVKGGVTSPEQKDWIAFLRGQGYGAIVCHGWIEARDHIIQYLEWK